MKRLSTSILTGACQGTASWLQFKSHKTPDAAKDIWVHYKTLISIQTCNEQTITHVVGVAEDEAAMGWEVAEQGGAEM
eukprot:1148901-Pelagomonas_calceolata.AAC.1